MTAVTKIRTDEVALRKARMLIGGRGVDSASGEVLEVEDPAHRRPIAEVPRGGAEDVARAVQASADAFPAWSRTIPRERGRLLARIADARAQRADWAGPGMGRSARQPPDGKQALLHRLDGGRQAHHARCLRPHRACVARTWRQESLDRLPRCKRGLGYRWNYCGDALHAAEPVLHRGLPPLPTPRHLRQFS